MTPPQLAEDLSRPNFEDHAATGGSLLQNSAVSLRIKGNLLQNSAVS
jgi:hypothetical protein